MSWALRSIAAGTAGTATLTLAYKFEHRIRLEPSLLQTHGVSVELLEWQVQVLAEDPTKVARHLRRRLSVLWHEPQEDLVDPESLSDGRTVPASAQDVATCGGHQVREVDRLDGGTGFQHLLGSRADRHAPDRIAFQRPAILRMVFLFLGGLPSIIS